MNITQSIKRRHYVELVLIYFVSHFLICVISGQWWDDWALWTNDRNHIKMIFSETGAPLESYNLFSVMWIPNWGYRIVVFMLFLIVGLLFYEILRKQDFLSEEDAFWIAGIAMTVPVNDARATLICYGYSLLLFFYMLSFYIVTRLSDMHGKKKIILHLISLACLLYSYMTESLLVFTGLIWLYLLYIVWVQNKSEKFLAKIRIFVRTHWDYIILPFAFYVVKEIFFKPYGRYTGYKNVSFMSLFNGIICSPLSVIKSGINIGYSYYCQIGVLSVVVLIVVITIYLFVSRRKMSSEMTDNKNMLKMNLILFALGCVVYYAGLFAYIVVRGGNPISNTGVNGRDSLLAGFGIAIMAVAFARILPVKKTLQNLLPILMIVFGIFHFNDWYLNYQEDWYHQQEFAKAIEDNQGMPEDDTILCEFLTASPTDGTRFYSLNGMSYMVTGRMDKFIFCGINELQYKEGFDDYFLKGNNCDDYDSTDMTIDGIMIINNEPISNIRLLRMRLNEIFRPEVFQDEINALTNVEYIRIDKKTSDKIYELYQKDELTSEILRTKILVNEQP